MTRRRTAPTLRRNEIGPGHRRRPPGPPASPGTQPARPLLGARPVCCCSVTAPAAGSPRPICSVFLPSPSTPAWPSDSSSSRTGSPAGVLPSPPLQLDAAFIAVRPAARKALVRKGNAPLPDHRRRAQQRCPGGVPNRPAASARQVCSRLPSRFSPRPPLRPRAAQPAARTARCRASRSLWCRETAIRSGPRPSSATRSRSAAIPDAVVQPAAGADHALRKGIDALMIATWLARFLP